MGSGVSGTLKSLAGFLRKMGDRFFASGDWLGLWEEGWG
jgi:hypothetical protein